MNIRFKNIHPPMVLLRCILVVLISSTWDVLESSAAKPKSLDQLKPREIQLLRGHTEPIVAVAFSPDSQTVAAASTGFTIRFWGVRNGETRNEIPIVTGSNQDNHTMTGLQIGGIGNRWLVGSSRTPWDTHSGALVVWNTENLLPLIRVDSKVEKSFTTCSIQPNGPFVAAGTIHGAVRIWNMNQGTPIRKGKKIGIGPVEILPPALALPSPISAIEFHPSQDSLVAGCREGGVGLLKISARGVDLDSNRFRDIVGPVRDIAMHPQGKSIAVVSGDVVSSWNFSDGKLIKKWKNPAGPARRVAFDFSGRILAVGYDDGRVRLWETVGERELDKLDPKAEKTITALAFSLDDRYLAAGSADTSVRVWELFGNGKKR